MGSGQDHRRRPGAAARARVQRLSVRTVLVPPSRLERWFENFGVRHGAWSQRLHAGCLLTEAQDGARCRARLPLGHEYDGPADVGAFAQAAAEPRHWGLLLVRKGGFAVARVHGAEVLDSKVGRRHVQGRTKAGGQSQQRFARRRENQAREAYEAAAEHASVVLGPHMKFLDALVCGGDRMAVEQVLSDPRLTGLGALRTDPWLDVPDPRRAVLDRAVLDGASVVMEVEDPLAR